MGAGLGIMAASISLKSKKIDPDKKPGLEKAREGLSRFKTEALSLARRDAEAFDGFMAAAGLPKDDPARLQRMQEASKAAEVPLETARTAAEARGLCQGMASLVSSAVSSDLNSALHLLRAAVLCAAENVRINLQSLKDPSRDRDLEAKLSAIHKTVQ